MKKVVFTLAIGDYPHEITDLTYPWLKFYARKIGAEFVEIKDRKFEEAGWGVTYEKHQIWDLGKDNDWNIFLDADALILPELFDVTSMVGKEYVVFAGQDMSAARFRPDRYFLRDGRYIGACSWFVVTSDWTHDLWRPLDDLKPSEACENIFPTRHEIGTIGIKPEKLIEDYSLSRNIARFGLKHTTVEDIKVKFNRRNDPSYWHKYTIPLDAKVLELKKIINQAGLPEKGWV